MCSQDTNIEDKKNLNNFLDKISSEKFSEIISIIKNPIKNNLNEIQLIPDELMKPPFN